MKYLVAIPIYTGLHHSQEAIESALKNDVDVLVIDNGSEADIKEMLNSYGNRIHVITNETNKYVNFAWNQAMEFLLKGDWDNLVILNSDAILCDNWNKFLDEYYDTFSNAIPVPNYITDKREIKPANINNWGSLQPFSYETTGYPNIAGVCIVLTREEVELVYPIPSELLCWFGDDFLYHFLMKHHNRSINIIETFQCYHAISQTIIRTPGISELIEKDKVEWEIIKQKHDL